MESQPGFFSSQNSSQKCFNRIGPQGTRRTRRPTSYQPPLVQCHVDPGRHIVTNELFPMVSAMLTARADGNGGNAVASTAEILGLAVLLSVVGSISWLRD